MNKMKLNLICAGFLFLSGQSFAQGVHLGLNFPSPQVNEQNTVRATSLNDLLSTGVNNQAQARESTVAEMRRVALVEMASALGASAGLNYAMQKYRTEINKNATELDALYDFSKLTIANGVLAPVLVEGLANFNKVSDDQIRIADKIFKIESPARFVSVYPTWRSYLRFTFPTFEIPPGAFLPQNEAEKAVWDAAIRDGWSQGEEQASRVLESSMARLERDFLGMIKFKILLEQRLITPTMVASQNLGVTGGGREMAINDQIFRITDHSALNPNTRDWRVEYPVTNQINGRLK